MSHASDKITVRCGNTLFSCCHNSHMPAHTRSAARSIYSTSCIYKNIQQSFFDTLLINLLCSRNNHHTHIRMYRMTFQYCRSFPHIFHSSVRTRTNHNLIDLNLFLCLDLINRLCVSRQMRKRYRRTHL